MSATGIANQGATDATPGVRLDFDVIDSVASERGATGDAAIGALLGMSRTTIWRIRNNRQTPSLETAVLIAQTLGLKLDEIMKRPTGEVSK